MRTRFWSVSEVLLLLGEIAAVLSVSTYVHASPFLVLDLGTLGGSVSATGDYGSALNNAGQVVGYSSDNSGTVHAFRTLPNSQISRSSDLHVGPYGAAGKAYAINTSGQTVGAVTGGGAFRTTSSGVIDSVSLLVGALYAFGINDAGQVVGATTNSSGSFRAYRTGPNAGLTAASDLGTLGGSQSNAFGVNASGQAVGWAYLSGDAVGHAFRTAPNGLITPASDLGTLGGPFAEAYAINNSGQVVGDSETTGGVTLHAFRTTATGVIDANSNLGALGGGASRAFAINAIGQTVGYYATNAGASVDNRAFFADSSGPMQALNSITPAGSGWVLQEAHGINDSGQISGFGMLRGQTHAFLTVPHGATVTESSSAPASAGISQPNFSAATLDPQKDYSDNAGPPGQTFTPATNMTLSGITVKGASNTSLTASAATFTITISRVNGTTLTRLDQEPTDSVLIANSADYLTFTLLNPVSLVAGTQYEFDISTGSGFFGFAKTATNVYAGGAAIQAGVVPGFSPDSGQITNSQTVDRTFFINPIAAPEPASLSLILGVAVVLGRRTPKRAG